MNTSDHTSPVTLVLGAILACLSSGVHAQDGLVEPTRSGALTEVDGVPWAAGAGYRARFDAAGFEFQPVLGERPLSGHAWSFALESVRRADGPAQLAVTPSRRVAERAVHYDRPGYVESYDVLEHGIEQSFTFATLPPGSGDLIVRGRVTTELEARDIAPDGIRFSRGGVSEVTVGAVTGIDARGARAPGALRYEDGVLELVLPARFVDMAALPLVLDPLIGTEVLVGDGGGAHAAYDATHDVFCVVWTGVRILYGRRFSGDGIAIGPEFMIAGPLFAPGSFRGYSIGSNNLRDRFLVVWTQPVTGTGLDIYGRSVRASDGALGPIRAVHTEAGDQSGPEVGGEATTLDDEVIVIFQDENEGDIEGKQVRINADGTIAPLATFDIRDNSFARGSTISKSGGASGRYLVAWHEDTGLAGRQNDVRGAIIDRNSNIIVPLFNIATTTADEWIPAVDGDGERWVVAYQTRAGSTSNSSIAARWVSLEGSSTTTSGQVLIADNNTLKQEGAMVAWAGGSAIVGWSRKAFGCVPGPCRFDPRVALVDPFTLVRCEGNSFVGSGSEHTHGLRGASEYSGDANQTADGALLVWTRDARVYARRYRADDGQVVDLGGGCGVDRGTPYATCAVVDNGAFRHRLQRAAAFRTVYLLLGFERIDAACGGCTLVPRPFTGFGFATTTDVRGHASIATPIPDDPALRGLRFYDQWLVLDSTPGCAALGTDLSNALEVRIQ